MNIVALHPEPNHYPRMTELARMFPTLDKADGVEPFDPQKLDDWTHTGAPCHAALWSVRFILAVWSGRNAWYRRTKTLKDEDGEIHAYLFRAETPWRCGPFDIVSALGTWDGTHREAFLSWARKPWWP